MDLRELVRAILTYDALGARQWVADSVRQGFDWRAVPYPEGLDPMAVTVAAGVAELLAHRSGQEPPAWTASAPNLAAPIYLVRAAMVMPRLRRLCEEEGPEPLRRRGLLAPPEFLKVA